MNAARLNDWRRRAAARWQAFAPRERRALRWLAVAVALAGTLQLAWTVDQARREQRRQLPRLVADAERMAGLVRDWQALSADTPAPPARADTLRTAVEARLGELGPGIAARWEQDGRLQLSGSTDFARWLRWTAALHSEHRLILDSCRIVAAAGGVSIEAAYAAAGGPR